MYLDEHDVESLIEACRKADKYALPHKTTQSQNKKVNNSRQTNKWCSNCKMSTHNTKDCYVKSKAINGVKSYQ